MIFADHALACRLERAEGLAGASFVETRGAPAEWREIAGVRAMFDGPQSPCTQTFGLGLAGLPDDAGMDLIEEFFRERGSAVSHEICPLGDAGTLPMVYRRGYVPVESTSVMYVDLAAAPPPGRSALRVRVAEPGDREVWARAAAEGWGLEEEMVELMRGSFAAPGTAAFLVELDGQVIATAAMSTHEGVALLAGASTLPQWRRGGAQAALMARRMAYARDAGCELVMFCAQPGSTSQRNAERSGFRVAYTRTRWIMEYDPEILLPE
jgi:N-acetylglutamate synthase-like GNAT family acetyltransferase